MAVYSKSLRVKVAKEAADSSYAGMEHVIAEKYGLRIDTVKRWRDIYLEHGEQGLSKGSIRSSYKKTDRELELEKENAELKEEIRILKKAAAFLADLRRE